MILFLDAPKCSLDHPNIPSMSCISKELKKRSCDGVPKDINVYQRWLNVWSALTMITCIIGLMVTILHRIQYICLFSSLFAIPTWLQPSLCLTVYQIIRLQYIFSASQIHSHTYAIPDSVFIFLYFNLIILFIAMYVFSFWTTMVNPSGSVGCTLDFKLTMDVHTIMAITGISWYYILDWMVLYLYIYKNHQIQIHTSFKQKKIYQRIKFIIHRIIVLTIFYELKSLTAIFINFTTTPLKPASVIAPIIVGIDTLLTVVIIYLMIEHNKKEYIKFLKVLRMNRLCYCCGPIVKQEPDFRENTDKITITVPPAEQESVDTKTKDAVEMAPETPKQVHPQSENTQIAI